MGLTNFNFYAANATRRYPIDDGARAVDDAGAPLPFGVLVDCHLRWPETAGLYAHLGALAVTEHLVTMVFLVESVPIAAATIRKPPDVGRAYAVEALYPGAGGWIVLGPGVDEPYSGRFTSAAQSLILPRCAAAYRVPPIPSIGKEFLDGALAGLVTLRSGADIAIQKAQREIAGAVRDCLVIRLVDDLDRNVLAVYSGPCSGRPESRTCPRPALEELNTVVPDCNGNLTIEFRNVAATPLAGGGGVVLDLARGLAASCAEKYLPDDAGRLPAEADDLCSSQSEILPPPPPPPPPPPDSSSVVLVPPTCVGLPYGDGFDAATLNPAWVAPLGSWAFEADDSPEEAYGVATFIDNPDPADPGRMVGWPTLLPAGPMAEPRTTAAIPVMQALAAQDQSRRNVILWDDCGYDNTLGLTARTHVKLKPGIQSNGGLVLNYRLASTTLRPQYYLLLASANTSSLELWEYNGTTISKLIGVPTPDPFKVLTERWYELTAGARLGGTGRVVVDGTLRAVDQPLMPVVTLSLAVNDYPPASGKMGLGSINAHALFSFYELQATPP
jgi:hypothetical protein